MLVLALKFSSSRDDERRPGLRDASWSSGTRQRTRKTEQRDYPNVRVPASGLGSLGLIEADCAAMTSDQRGSRWIGMTQSVDSLERR
jgi:hypothetical protein